MKQQAATSANSGGQNSIRDCIFCGKDRQMLDYISKNELVNDADG